MVCAEGALGPESQLVSHGGTAHIKGLLMPSSKQCLLHFKDRKPGFMKFPIGRLSSDVLPSVIRKALVARFNLGNAVMSGSYEFFCFNKV